MFARLWVFLTMAAFRLWPLLAMTVHARHHPVAPMAWGAAFGATLILVVVAQASAMRCSSEQLPHTRGLLVVGAAMSTGWTYLDAMLVPLAVAVVLLVSVLLAVLPGASIRYLALVRRVAEHRMQQ